MIEAELYIDNHNREWIFNRAPDRVMSTCICKYDFIELPSGSIFKLIGKHPRPGHIYKLQSNEKLSSKSKKENSSKA